MTFSLVYILCIMRTKPFAKTSVKIDSTGRALGWDALFWNNELLKTESSREKR